VSSFLLLEGKLRPGALVATGAGVHCGGSISTCITLLELMRDHYTVMTRHDGCDRDAAARVPAKIQMRITLDCGRTQVPILGAAAPRSSRVQRVTPLESRRGAPFADGVFADGVFAGGVAALGPASGMVAAGACGTAGAAAGAGAGVAAPPAGRVITVAPSSSGR